MSSGGWRGEPSGWEPVREPRQPPRLQTSVPGRPQIYVHFEFGVSFSQKQGPKPHSVTYMSKGMRERDQRSHYPRQLPPPNTNYLEQPLPENLAYSRQRAVTQPTAHQASNYHAHQHAHQHGHTHSTSLSRQDEPYRHTRLDNAPGYYERGSSAPPPMNDSPWDVEPEPVGFSALPRNGIRQPQVWKDLPAAPRDDGAGLGNDGMPLSAHSWPAQRWEDEEADQQPSSSARRRLDVPDYGQARDLATLSSAMMTVDNGFEDQWWYQGPRETHAGDLGDLEKRGITHTRSMPTSPQSPQDSTMSDTTVGWAVAKDEGRPIRTSSLAYRQARLTEEWANTTRQFAVPPSATTITPASASAARRDFVSPITEANSPPNADTPIPHEQRSGSTELFYYK